MAIDELKAKILSKLSQPIQKSFGTVQIIKGGIIIEADGLGDVGFRELVRFSRTGDLGLVMDMTDDTVKVVPLAQPGIIQIGDEIQVTGRVIETPVGPKLVGRIVDALGRPIDDKGPLGDCPTRGLFTKAPDIPSRQKVQEPLFTGSLVVDALTPIGRGQRMLIIGDKMTGKTTLAIDAILAQKYSHQTDTPVHCIYCAIGRRSESVNKSIDILRKNGALSYTTIVSATPDNPPIFLYLAPYTACSIAEAMMEQGGHVLVVFDDLSQHAFSYRSLVLLLELPVGREAYPGDIFYIHSSLLERSTRMSDDKGGGSLTAMALCEIPQEVLETLIPTNLISITDGQIYLLLERWNVGQKPALDPGLSVSRVGGDAQTRSMKHFAGDLRLSLAKLKELQLLAKTGQLGEKGREIYEQGMLYLELMKQKPNRPLSELEMVAKLAAVKLGLITSETKNIDGIMDRVLSSGGKLELTPAAVEARIKAVKEQLQRERKV